MKTHPYRFGRSAKKAKGLLAQCVLCFHCSCHETRQAMCIFTPNISTIPLMAGSFQPFVSTWHANSHFMLRTVHWPLCRLSNQTAALDMSGLRPTFETGVCIASHFLCHLHPLRTRQIWQLFIIGCLLRGPTGGCLRSK